MESKWKGEMERGNGKGKSRWRVNGKGKWKGEMERGNLDGE